MNDQHIPDWAIAKAFWELYNGDYDSYGSLFGPSVIELARELSAQQPYPRDDELPGMWERADFMGGATDFSDQQPDAEGEAVVCPKCHEAGDDFACQRCGCLVKLVTPQRGAVVDALVNDLICEDYADAADLSGMVERFMSAIPGHVVEEITPAMVRTGIKAALSEVNG